MHTPRKRFGQNFLQSDAVILQMVQAISPRAQDHLVEIGPGRGALTEPLLQAVDHLDVIELDRDLIPILKAKFLTTGKLNIYESDVLKFDFKTLIQQDGRQNNKIRVVGNLPYNISTELLFYLFNFLSDLLDMHFLLQKEVVDRLAAPVGSSEYGRLSVLVQYYCDVEPLFLVQPESFYPIPKVMSQFVRLTPKPKEDLNLEVGFEKLDQLLREAFQMRRKTLKNNLRKLLSDTDFQKLNINPEDRPQDLSLDQFVQLAKYAASHGLL